MGSVALDLALTDREPQGLSRYSAALPAGRKRDLAFPHPELRVLMIGIPPEVVLLSRTMI